jgi:DNA-binding response OmpR family regulator
MDEIEIIYIEDDVLEAELFTMGLEPRGVQVLHFSDADDDTLRVLHTPRYQSARAIFVDLWIGVVNGIEVVRMLRQRGDIRPMFLLTAGQRPDRATLESLDLMYIQKPVDYKMLSGLINSLPVLQ